MKIIVWFSVLMMVFFGYSCTSGKGDGIRYIFFLIGDWDGERASDPELSFTGQNWMDGSVWIRYLLPDFQ